MARSFLTSSFQILMILKFIISAVLKSPCWFYSPACKSNLILYFHTIFSSFTPHLLKHTHVRHPQTPPGHWHLYSHGHLWFVSMRWLSHTGWVLHTVAYCVEILCQHLFTQEAPFYLVRRLCFAQAFQVL